MKKALAIALLITLAILAMCGCATKNRCAQKYPCPTITYDSRSTSISTVIDTIHLTPDSALYKALIECQNGKPVVISEWADNGVYLDIAGAFKPGEKATVGQLIVKAIQPSKAIVTPKTITSINTTYKKEALQVCPGLTGWQWFQIWVGRIAIALLLCYIIVKIVKRFL